LLTWQKEKHPGRFSSFENWSLTTKGSEWVKKQAQNLTSNNRKQGNEKLYKEIDTKIKSTFLLSKYKENLNNKIKQRLAAHLVRRALEIKK